MCLNFWNEILKMSIKISIDMVMDDGLPGKKKILLLTRKSHGVPKDETIKRKHKLFHP